LGVVGVDRSQPMLAIAEAKRQTADPAIAGRLESVEGDMRDVELGRTFRLVIIAFRSFAHLLTVGDRRRRLATARRHLDPGGLLALNIFLYSHAVPGMQADAASRIASLVDEAVVL